MFDNIFFSFENRVVCEIMWKNNVEPERPQTITWRMRIACWIHKSTNTHSEYVIINAFLQRQRLHERASVLRYTYIACLVSIQMCSQDSSVGIVTAGEPKNRG